MDDYVLKIEHCLKVNLCENLPRRYLAMDTNVYHGEIDHIRQTHFSLLKEKMGGCEKIIIRWLPEGNNLTLEVMMSIDFCDFQIAIDKVIRKILEKNELMNNVKIVLIEEVKERSSFV